MEHAERYMEIWKSAIAAEYASDDPDVHKFTHEIFNQADEGHKSVTGMDCAEALLKQPALELEPVS